MKRLFCFVCLLVFCVGAFAQEGAEALREEKQALVYAKRVFQDRLYDVATKKLKEFLKDYPKSSFVDEADWLLAQSFYFQGKYEDALALFRKKAEEKEARGKFPWDFWVAETLAALNRWPEAREAYQNFIVKNPESQNLFAARLGLAGALFHQDKIQESLEILKELEALGPRNPIGQRVMLLRSKIDLSENRIKEAKKLLRKLADQKLNPPILFEVQYWLGETFLMEGNAREALKHYRRVTEDRRASPKETVILSWVGNGRALKALKDWEDAAGAFERVFELSEDQKALHAAMRNFLECHRENQSLVAGALKLRDWAKKTGQAVAFYAVAQAYHQAENTAAALAELDSLIKAHPDSQWTPEAYFLMGTILAEANQTKAAVEKFSQLIERDQNSARSMDARFRLAELHFENRQFSLAAEVYRQIAQNHSDDPFRFEMAFFNTLLALGRDNKIEDFLETEKSFVAALPESVHLRTVFLEKARLLNEAGRGNESREILQQIIEKYPDDQALLAQVSFMLAASFFRDADYSAAARQFQSFEDQFPDSEMVVEAAYHRIIAQLRSERIDSEAARRQYSRLLEAHPKHALAPSIMFRLAQTYYDQQNYGEAEKVFLQLAEKHPKHLLANEALYYAGKSLMWLTNYQAAIAVFEKISDASSLKAEARLAEIDSYRLLGQFPAALKIANSLLPAESTVSSLTSIQVEALLRKAAVLFTMAAEKSDLYREALQTAGKVLAAPNSNIAQRNHAGFIKGKSLQKLNRVEEASQAYLDVLYGKVLPSHLTGPTQPEHQWFTRCGVEAAQMKESGGDIAGAIAIYRILERLSGPNREEFSQKIQDLRTRHFIWE